MVPFVRYWGVLLGYVSFAVDFPLVDVSWGVDWGLILVNVSFVVDFPLVDVSWGLSGVDSC